MSTGFNNRPPVGQSILNNLAENFTGIFSTRPTAKYASGARCVLKINGKVVGFAFGVSWRINTNYTEINCLDDPLSEELVPQRSSVEGTISAMHIPGVSATTEGWQPDVLSFLFGKYIAIEVRDSQSDQLLFFTAKAVITSRLEEVRVDQLSSVSLSFRAIGWRDEKDPSFPSDAFGKPGEQSSPQDSLIPQIPTPQMPTAPKIPSTPKII